MHACMHVCMCICMHGRMFAYYIHGYMHVHMYGFEFYTRPTYLQYFPATYMQASLPRDVRASVVLFSLNP